MVHFNRYFANYVNKTYKTQSNDRHLFRANVTIQEYTEKISTHFFTIVAKK